MYIMYTHHVCVVIRWLVCMVLVATYSMHIVQGSGLVLLLYCCTYCTLVLGWCDMWGLVSLWFAALPCLHVYSPDVCLDLIAAETVLDEATFAEVSVPARTLVMMLCDVLPLSNQTKTKPKYRNWNPQPTTLNPKHKTLSIKTKQNKNKQLTIRSPSFTMLALA